MSTLFTAGLDIKRQEVYRKLTSFSDDFVLAGGTAIMFQINHRVSFDFDCFSLNPLKANLLPKVRSVFGEKLNVQVNNEDLLLFTTPSGVKIDFVYYPYPRLHKLIRTGPIPLLSLRDLSTNKAHTIGRRATWRDYVDLFFLLRSKENNLSSIISESKKRFKSEFSEKLFLEQLVYYEDVVLDPIEFIKKKYTNKQIQKYLAGETQKYTRARLQH